MFQQITITIDLSEPMKQDMPKSGAGEMTAMDKHSAIIDRVLVDPLKEELAADLRQLGYFVAIDD